MSFDYENIINTVFSHFFKDIKEDDFMCPIDIGTLPITKIGDSYILEYHKSIPIFENLLKKTLNNYDMAKTNMIFSISNNAFGKNLFDAAKSLYNSFIVVFYPEIGLEKVYELMMTTSTYPNVSAVMVKGDINNCKEVIEKIKKNKSFSFIDESNPAVLIPRILYLFFTYKKMLDDKFIEANEKIDIFLSPEDETYIDAIKIACSLSFPINNIYISPIADLSLVNNKIKETFTKYKTIVDPYTACSLIASNKKSIILSLTSPYIYARTVDEAIRDTSFNDVTDEYSFFEDLSLLSMSDVPIHFQNIYNKRIMHYDILDKENAELYITKLLGNYR